MPIYEYCCRDCEHLFEEWSKSYEEKEKPCPACGGNARRLISPTAFILKGSGWYATDYARSQASHQSGNGNGSGGEQTESTEQKGESQQEKSTGQESQGQEGASKTSETKSDQGSTGNPEKN